MAALALPVARAWALSPSRLLQPLFSRPSWSLPCEPSTSAPLAQPSGDRSSPTALIAAPAATPQAWLRDILPSWEDLVEMFPPIVLAVPKKRTSHRRKALRNAPKQPKNKANFELCKMCGEVKLQHHLCPKCYSSIHRAWRAASRIRIRYVNTDPLQAALQRRRKQDDIDAKKKTKEAEEEVSHDPNADDYEKYSKDSKDGK